VVLHVKLEFEDQQDDDRPGDYVQDAYALLFISITKLSEIW
jgi:hypothetical protein